MRKCHDVGKVEEYNFYSQPTAKIQIPGIKGRLYKRSAGSLPHIPEISKIVAAGWNGRSV